MEKGKESNPPPGQRQPIDDLFVYFLSGYMAHPECSREFRRILQGGLLKERPDRLQRLALAFQTPEMKRFVKGILQRRLSRYDLTLPPRHISEATLYGQIRPPGKSKQRALPGLGEGGSTGEKRKKGREEQGKPHVKRLRPDRIDPSRVLSAPVEKLTTREALDFYEKHLQHVGTAPETEELGLQQGDGDSDVDDVIDITEDYMMLLDASRFDADMTDAPPQLPEEVVDEDESDRAVKALKRVGDEWRNDSYYKGSRQPPLGIRLEHVLNFLREEDVDRHPHWASKLQEIVDYLDWLGEADPDRQLDRCGLEVRNMYRDALVKIDIHKEFEKFHYAPTELAFEDTPLPRPSGRLAWLGNGQLGHPARFVPSEPQVLGPRPLVSGPIAPVNSMFPPGDRDGAAFRERLHAAEKALFSSGEQKGVAANAALFVVENETYEDLVAQATGWIDRDPSTGEACLPNGASLKPGSSGVSHARERGARRAGLQLALRSFAAVEHAMLMTPWRRVALPVEARELERVRQDADKNLHWQPLRLGLGQLPGQLETAPYTYWWREHAKSTTALREHAREKALFKQGRWSKLVTVPKGAVSGAPLVWRGVGRGVELSLKKLRECEAIEAMLLQAEERAAGDRPMLPVIRGLCRRAKAGDFGLAGKVPHGDVDLRADEWDGEVGTHVRDLSPDEMDWLKLLSSDWTTDKTTPVTTSDPAQEQQGRIFTIFAGRVNKVLRNPDPEAPFADADATMSVEELLAAMNRGCDGPVRKTRFTVTDAMCWLPKLAGLGKVSFRQDLECYGVVGLPNQVYPEERIKCLGDETGHLRACDVSATEVELTTAQWRTIRRFFYNLGFRLGLTILRLRTQAKHWVKNPPLPVGALADSMADMEALYKDQIGTEGPVPLAEVVRKANPADYREGMTEQEALALIRSRVIDESTANLSMLAPGRPRADGRGGLARDLRWDWASVRVRAESKRFWSLDRWPVAMQSEETKQRIRQDADVDPRMIWGPREEDRTDDTVVRPKLRRYGDRPRVHYRSGPAVFPIGDTPLQRKAIEARMTAMVAEAMGIDTAPTRSWGKSLSRMFGFGRQPSPGSDSGSDVPGECYLPKVDQSSMPTSWDPRRVEEVEDEEEEEETADV